ncbi:hypothetical protein MTP99_004890 [Tenebrio molitor]|nr:hypothetical protein MTP99_004890 [Tenebrio molitor]
MYRSSVSGCRVGCVLCEAFQMFHGNTYKIWQPVAMSERVLQCRTVFGEKRARLNPVDGIVTTAADIAVIASDFADPPEVRNEVSMPREHLRALFGEVETGTTGNLGKEGESGPAFK